MPFTCSLDILHSMDSTQRLVKLSHLIQAISATSENAIFLRKNCYDLAAAIENLLPLVGELQELKTALTGGTIASFEGLERSLLKVKELFERCGGKSSRFYVVLRRQKLVPKFQLLASDIWTYLSSLPLGALQLTDKTQQQVEKCIFELRGATYHAELENELAKETDVVLKELRDGMKISHEKLADLASKFHLRLNQEILREASLLEKEKENIRAEKDKHEEEFINQIIVLVTSMADDLAEQKQSQVEFGSMRIPADFLCPLSLELMSDPVIVASGQTYERNYIQQWLDEGNATCPKTRQTLNHTNLIPNYTVKALIANWCDLKNVPFPEPSKSSSIALQSGTAPTIVASNSSLPNGAHLQDILGSISRTDGPVAPISGNRTPERVFGSTHTKVFEDHQGDAGRIGHAIGSGEGSSVYHSRPLQNGNATGRFLSTVSRNGDHHEDSIHAHSRNTSSSSVASSADDALNPQSDENTRESSQGLNGFTSYDSDMSEELQRESVQSLQQSTNEENRGSLSTVDINRVSVAMMRRGGSDPNSLSISVPSNADAVDANENDTQRSVSRLVEELKFNSIDIQRNAATELRFLARHSMDNRILIANSGAIRPLVTLLDSADSQTQENAVTALLNLSINDQNKNEIAAAGAIDPLVQVLRVGNSQAKENSAATLFSLSVMDQNKIAIGQSGAIPLLVELLMHGTARGKKDAATALFNLSIHHENKARIVGAGAIKPLVELMADPAAGMVDKAVAVLANLATIPEGRSAIGEEGGIPALVEVVEMGSQRGKENAAAALLHLCTNNHRFRAMVLQEGAIPPLVALSQSGTARAKEKASALLRHFREQRHAVLGRGGQERNMDHRRFDRQYG